MCLQSRLLSTVTPSLQGCRREPDPGRRVSENGNDMYLFASRLNYSPFKLGLYLIILTRIKLTVAVINCKACTVTLERYC
jgi:hypothetical protein